METIVFLKKKVCACWLKLARWDTKILRPGKPYFYTIGVLYILTCRGRNLGFKPHEDSTATQLLHAKSQGSEMLWTKPYLTNGKNYLLRYLLVNSWRAIEITNALERILWNVLIMSTKSWAVSLFNRAHSLLGRDVKNILNIWQNLWHLFWVTVGKSIQGKWRTTLLDYWDELEIVIP